MLNGEAWRVATKIIDPVDFEGYAHCRICLAMETLAGLCEAIDIQALCGLPVHEKEMTANDRSEADAVCRRPRRVSSYT